MCLVHKLPGHGNCFFISLEKQQNFSCFWQTTGNVIYNGETLDNFRVQRTAAYISQTDNHIAELTVRETFDFAARCQGASEGFAGLSTYE